jgi:hypothetical protein
LLDNRCLLCRGRSQSEALRGQCRALRGLCFALAGLPRCAIRHPGRRCALPRAGLLLPLPGRQRTCRVTCGFERIAVMRCWTDSADRRLACEPRRVGYVRGAIALPPRRGVTEQPGAKGRRVLRALPSPRVSVGSIPEPRRGDTGKRSLFRPCRAPAVCDSPPGAALRSAPGWFVAAPAGATDYLAVPGAAPHDWTNVTKYGRDRAGRARKAGGCISDQIA